MRMGFAKHVKIPAFVDIFIIMDILGHNSAGISLVVNTDNDHAINTSIQNPGCARILSDLRV